MLLGTSNEASTPWSLETAIQKANPQKVSLGTENMQ
jgi:hypothetical protein